MRLATITLHICRSSVLYVDDDVCVVDDNIYPTFHISNHTSSLSTSFNL